MHVVSPQATASLASRAVLAGSRVADGCTSLQNVQRTCKQLHSLLAAPISQDTWGSITLRSNQLDHKSKLDRPQDVQRLCMWVQRRSAGKYCSLPVLLGHSSACAACLQVSRVIPPA